jgi:DNA ligase-1
MSLQRLQEFVTEANSTNSSNAKKAVIEKYPDLKPYWLMTYDCINYRYNVKSDHIKKLPHLVAEDHPYENVLDLLIGLNNREVTGHEAISVINKFVSQNVEHTDLIYNMIDRNLKTRTDAKLINKVFPKTIPEFEVALAETYNDKTSKVVTWDGNWLCSRKLDGCRCLAVIDSLGEVKIYSRQGLEFLTLGKVVEAIKELNLTNFVLDGEICLVDENGDEDFTSIMKQIRKKDHTIPNPKYKIFDGLPKDKFEDKYYEVPLIDRLIALIEIVPKDHDVLSLLKQVRIDNAKAFENLQQQSSDGGWEGLILRKNSPYQGKRSKDMLKVKEFHDAEYVVTDVTMGPFRHIDDETGLEVETELLSRVSIEHKGHEVGVGSGFSLAERKRFHANPDELIGKTITVCYFEESHDENGIPSLRFPTVKAIHGIERTT